MPFPRILRRLALIDDDSVGASPSLQDRATADDLIFIAREFIALQQDSKMWSDTEVEDAIMRARSLYLGWSTVRDTPMAQSYLLDMIGGR